MSQQYSGSAEGAPDAATRATTRPVARATRRSATFFALKSDDPSAGCPGARCATRPAAMRIGAADGAGQACVLTHWPRTYLAAVRECTGPSLGQTP